MDSFNLIFILLEIINSEQRIKNTFHKTAYMFFNLIVLH